MDINGFIQNLLRSRLYRATVLVAMADGRRVEGCVEELRYDGSRSVVVLRAAGGSDAAWTIKLSTIREVSRPTRGRLPTEATT